MCNKSCAILFKPMRKIYALLMKIKPATYSKSNMEIKSNDGAKQNH